MIRDTELPMRRVQLWFGDNVIGDYTAPSDQADEYAAAIQRRFAGLRVTIADPDGIGPPLPAKHWWAVTPK